MPTSTDGKLALPKKLNTRILDNLEGCLIITNTFCIGERESESSSFNAPYNWSGCNFALLSLGGGFGFLPQVRLRRMWCGSSLTSHPANLAPALCKLLQGFNPIHPQETPRCIINRPASQASVQSIGKYIFKANYTQVNVENSKEKRHSLPSKHPHTGYFCHQNGWLLLLRSTLPLHSILLGCD